MHLRSSAFAAAICVLAGAAPAAAADPPLTVPKAKLDAALHCHGKLHGAKRQPIMLVTGTGATGDEAYAVGKGAFDAFGHPVCTVNYPDFTTADIQVSVQYLVSGIRAMERRADRPIAIFGISQGGLLPRWALTFAAFADALTHKGAARIARLPKDVCAHPYAAGLDEAGTTALLGASGNLITPRLVNQVPRAAAEPPVRAYARRPAD
jgi:hypothetical protein